MLKFALLALIAVVAGVAATGVVEQHDAAIAEVAAAMPEHAEAFAEVAAAAGTKDVFAVLDAISANIESERKHAQVFYRSYKKTTARDLRRYKLLIAKLSAGERRGKQATKGERVEARQLRRAVNANVRKLSRAVARFQHVQGEERRTTHKKKAALRHINNKIADRKTYLKVLKAIAAALRDTKQPVAARFLEALSVAHSNGMGAHADAPTVFLQMDAAEAVDESADNADEAEVDAGVDAEAFEMENMPSEQELELVDEDEAEAEDEEMTAAEEDAEDAAEDAAEDQDEAELEAEEESEEESAEENAAESALDAAEEAEEEESDALEQEEESASEAEAEAEADSDSEAEDSGSEARMMQVLSALATGARDDASVQELLTLIDALVADVREGIAAAKKRRVAVLTKYAEQMKNLQALANSIKDSIRRLQVTVQTGRARLAELEGTATAVQANSKEAQAQLTAYRGIAKGIRKNWAKYQARYKKNQKRRDKQLEQLAELKRRLAAIERERGSLGIDLSAVNLRYRWKAYPFGACQAACGPSKRARKVKCLSFSGKPVKHSFCAGQKKPKVHVKCQKKACPIACVASEWKARGKCSNQCGTGVRLHTRSIIEPARFGGRCPQQFKLTKHKACKSLKACAPGAEPTAQSRADGKAAIAAARKARQDAKIASAQAAAAKRAEALLGGNPNAASSASATSAPLTAKQQAKRAKNKRCRACAKGKKGGACRFKNCLNKAQKLACKACPKGKAGKHCRLRKCKGPAMARRRALKKRAAKRKAAKAAAAKAAAAAAGQAPQQPLTKLQKKIRSLKAKIAARRAHCARCRKLKKDGKKKKAKRCRKNRKCGAIKRWESELAAARKARAAEKKRLAAGKAPLTALQKRIRSLKARIAKLKAKCQKCRDLKKAKKLKKAKRCRKHRKCKKVAKRIAKLEKALAAARAARAAEKAGAAPAKKAKGAKGSKKSAKKYRKCRAKCRAGKKGKKCRAKCRNARLRRAAERQRREHRAREERRKRRAARRAAEKKRREALAKAKADAAAAAAAAAPAAPATPAAAAPAPASPAPAPADDSMSPEVVIAKFRQQHAF